MGRHPSRPPRRSAPPPRFRSRTPSLSPAPPSPTLAAAATGCAASTADGARAEPRRRGWARARALGHSEASTSGLPVPPQQQGQEAESSSGGRRRGCKVAPEPKELEEGTAALPPMSGPGSPSFRHYCQKKTAAVDRIVADSDNSDGSVRIKATAGQLSNRSQISETYPHDSNEVSQHKEGNRWLRFSGLSAVAAACHNLFSRQRSKPSPPPAAAPAASSEP